MATGDQLAIQGLDPTIASLEHRPLIHCWEPWKTTCCSVSCTRKSGWPIGFRGGASAAVPRNVPWGGEGSHGLPPFKAAMGGEDLVEQPAHV